MHIKFAKYHALYNDFLVIEAGSRKLPRKRLELLSRSICDRRAGVGADGILYLSPERDRSTQVDLYNSDGGWAEKSGNGLRIVALHRYRKDQRRRKHIITMNEDSHEVSVLRKAGNGWLVRTGLGQPEFNTARVPVRSRSRFWINAPLVVGGLEFPVTCLSVGNPHAVLLVDNFDFDWQGLGAEIECHRAFPSNTNVEFVRAINRKRIEVADWERGAGATGSSGTGAAASVCACVMLGLVDRECEVVFETGSLFISWEEQTDLIRLTGPVSFVCEGEYEFS